MRAAVVLFYATVSAVMAGPMVNYSALATASYAGDARLVIWGLAWANHAVLAGRPLFESNIFYPTPQSLAYNEHLFGVSLFTLPIYAATQNPVLAYNTIWLLSFLLNGLAAHALLRRYTGSHLAAITGSLIYSFSFYKMLHGHGHLQHIWTWLLPLSVLCLERWRDRPTFWRASLWAAAVVLQSLASWYLAVMIVLVQAIVLAGLLPALRRDGRLGAVWQLAAAAVVAGAVLWPFARPYRVLPETPRAEMVRNSADVAAYVVPPENTWVGRLWLKHVGRGPRWIWGERTLFVGWIALALACVGLYDSIRRRQWPYVAVYVTITGLAFALSLGPSLTGSGETWSPFGMLTLLPGLGGFRVPARFSLLVTLGVAVFAAFGARLLAGTRPGRLAVIALLPLMLSEWYVVGFPGGKPQPFAIPPVYRTEAIAGARALVSLPDYRGTPDWGFGSDYLYFSTAHWRPIVNGFGRSEPPEHFRIASHMSAFPGPNNARTMRSLGVEYVVLHAGRYPDGAKGILQEAMASDEYEVVARVGTDYLFRVRPH